MSDRKVDVAVIGAGIIGAAATWMLAARGSRIALFEQFDLGHTRGSSHGASRIYRIAYNDAGYVPIAQRALPLWRQAEAELRQKLLHTTGGLDFGMPEDLEPIAGHLGDAGVPYYPLSRAQVAERFPAYLLPAGWEAIYQPDAGILDADACRLGLVELAQRHGASILPRTTVLALSPSDWSVAVETNQGLWEARHVVVAAGAWTNRLLEPLRLEIPLRVTREQVGYFAYREAIDLLVFRWPARDRPRRIYGLPNGTYDEVKVAEHLAGPEVSPDDPGVAEQGRLEPVRDFVRAHLPGLCDQPIRVETCLYASTPDEDFVIDRAGQIILAVGFGGHGFKFGAAIGQLVADMIDQDQEAPFAAFRRARFC